MQVTAQTEQSLEELQAILADVQSKIAAKKGGPANLLDALIAEGNLKNASGLARVLGVSPSTLSGIKAGNLPVTERLMVKIHEECGWSIARIKSVLRVAA